MSRRVFLFTFWRIFKCSEDKNEGWMQKWKVGRWKSSLSESGFSGLWDLQDGGMGSGTKGIEPFPQELFQFLR